MIERPRTTKDTAPPGVPASSDGEVPIRVTEKTATTDTSATTAMTTATAASDAPTTALPIPPHSARAALAARDAPDAAPVAAYDAPSAPSALDAEITESFPVGSPFAPPAPVSDAPVSPDAPQVSPGRAHLILAAALLAVFVGSLDLTVIATLLPRMVSSLNIPTADLDRYIWVVSGYLLAYMVTIPVFGRISDITGRRAVFAASLLIFVAGSALTAVAGDLPTLIAGRVVQGFGGGALVPVTMALVGDLYPPRKRAALVGLVGAVDTLGWVLGPLYGAALLNLTGDWRAVFWVNVPLALVTAGILLLAWRGVPQVRVREGIDVAGAVLLTVALAGLNLALSTGGEAGGGGGQLGGTPNPLAPYRLPLLGVAAGAFLLFLLVEWQTRSPLVPLSLFRRPAFAAATLANLLVGAALIAVMVDVPLFASLTVAERDASTVGALLLTPFTLTMALGSVLGGALSGRIGGRPVAMLGVLVAAVSLVAMRWWPDAVEWQQMGGTLAGAGFGFGLVIAPIASVAIGAVSRQFYGVASGLVVVTRLIGMTVGLSALTSWGVGRLSALLQMTGPVQAAGEADLAFQTRLFDYVGRLTVPYSLVTLKETFVIAGVICLIALIPALFLGGRVREPARGIHRQDAKDAKGGRQRGTL